MEKSSDSKISPGYTYIHTKDGLARVTAALSGTNRVGLDTEADSLHHYFEKVCLIQLSFSGTNYIIDPLVDFSLTEFFEALSEKELILQGADYDLRMLKKSFGFQAKAPVFDTMLAAKVLGYEQIGLAALVEKFCGVSLSKSGQKSDWSRRPLPEGLLIYASDDTKYLETLAETMTENLQKLNRLDWHRECCSRVVKTASLAEKIEVKDPWRIKGSSKLAPNVLAFVRELWKWRDAEARKRDRPPFMIMLNENIIELAEWRAKNPQTPLPQGPAFLKRVTGDVLTRLESAILTAENLPPAEWPTPPPKPERSEPWPDLEKLDPLLSACKALASELQMESCFLASRAALTAVVQHQPKSIEHVMEVSGLMRWQADLMMPVIQKILSGRV